MKMLFYIECLIIEYPRMTKYSESRKFGDE